MRVLGKEELRRLLRADESARTWIRAWVAELANANWKQPADVRKQFPRVRQDDSGNFVFPITNCDKEVCIQIAFPQGIAIITGYREGRSYGS